MMSNLTSNSKIYIAGHEGFTGVGYLGLHPFEAKKNLDRLAEVFEKFIGKTL